MAKVVLLSLSQIARSISDHIGKEVDKNWCSKHLKQIDDPSSGVYTPSKQFTGEQCILLTSYANEWYGRRSAPLFRRWINEHGHPVPPPFQPPVKVKQKPKQKEPETGVSSRELQRVVDRAVEKALKSRPVMGAISGPPNREEHIKPLNKAVVGFSLKHPIEVNECWKWLQRLWEERHGAKVMRVGDQSFPQWLHSSGNMDQMMDQLQGYFDFMHDELCSKQNRLGL